MKSYSRTKKKVSYIIEMGIEQRTGLVLKLVKHFSDNFEVLYAKNHPDHYHVLIGGEIEDRIFSKEEIVDEINFCLSIGYELLHGRLDLFI